MRIRPALVSLHRWIGLTFGVLLVAQSLTGAVMLFRNELTLVLHRAALTVQPTGSIVPVQELLDRVRAVHPQLRVGRIEFPKQPTQALMFRLDAADGGQRYVAVDQYRGVITRDRPLSGWPVHWLFRLHHDLLGGDTGIKVVGVVGAGLLVLALTGPFVWWPGRRNLRHGFSVTLSGNTFRATRDLHRVAGIVMAVVLLTCAMTGVMIVWKSVFQSAVATVMPVSARPAPQVSVRPDATFLAIDQLIAAGRLHYGGSPVTNVLFPGGLGTVVTVIVEATGTDRPRAGDQIWLDGYTGEVLGTYAAASVPAGNQVLDWIVPVHTGQALGATGRWLFLATALVLPMLAVTGVMQWSMRRRRLRSG